MKRAADLPLGHCWTTSNKWSDQRGSYSVSGTLTIIVLTTAVDKSCTFLVYWGKFSPMTPDTEARRVSKFSQHFEVKVNFPEIIDFRFRRMSSLKRGGLLNSTSIWQILSILERSLEVSSRGDKKLQFSCWNSCSLGSCRPVEQHFFDTSWYILEIALWQCPPSEPLRTSFSESRLFKDLKTLVPGGVVSCNVLTQTVKTVFL